MITPLYGQLSPLRIPTSSRFISADADVSSYILAVESADGQQLEAGVISAVESFVLGCKSDGIWNALKASCILAGARSLSGALVPLVGTAPTNFNFVSSDYNRETGLKGDGATKYLNPNRNNNADPQNSKHLAVYATQLQTGVGWYIGGQTNSNGNSFIYLTSTSVLRLTINANSTGNLGSVHAVGLLGCNRKNATILQGRSNKATQGDGITTIAVGSNAPSDYTPDLFRRHLGDNYSNSRLSFYSIGESLDLALLDTRVSNLMTALAATIPRAPVSDVDALAYIAAVETADAQTLEDSVKFAYEDFILGCKADGVWSAIKASCILAGARTLSGALVPLVGTAPTNNNFVSADYNRVTGLKGNTTTKYINAQRAINADPQNSHHYGVYVTEAPTLTTTRGFIGNAPSTGVNNYMQGIATGNTLQAYNRNPVGGPANQAATTGYKGTTRSASNSWSVRSGGLNTNLSTASVTPNSSAFGVFARGTTTFADARMSFYSIGESLDLALLDTRVSNLMTTLAASNI